MYLEKELKTLVSKTGKLRASLENHPAALTKIEEIFSNMFSLGFLFLFAHQKEK